MSHGKLRQDKNCLNCGHDVEEHFCPHCGQENLETKRAFHYLFTHFIEDLTHYDGQFWGTIKNLLFRPGCLTKIYLEGKRQKYVPPVKLYIFISFITFFLFALFPPLNLEGTSQDKNNKNSVTLAEASHLLLQETINVANARRNNVEVDSASFKKIDSLKHIIQLSNHGDDIELNWNAIVDADNKMDDTANFNGYKNYEAYKASNKLLPWIQEPVAKKFFTLRDQGVKKGEIYKNLFETSLHNLPKALFIYLPVFALFMWFFHNKKKWWYYDHGVFTLHYFSFLLISILCCTLLLKLIGTEIATIFKVLIFCVVGIISFYSFFYFFVAHHKVYKSHSLISIVIGGLLLALNFIFFMILLVGLAIISFIMMH